MNNKTILIGEAGVNHNGSEENALALADLAKKANVDIVKYQIFKSDQLVTKNTPKAKYQHIHCADQESQRDMLSRLELDFETHKRIANHCKNIGLQYLASAFDFDSLKFLAEEINVSLFKIPSGELTNAPLLLAHAKYRRKLIVSTGMSSLGEIEDALGVLAFGLLDLDEAPTIEGFKHAYHSIEGQAILRKFVTLLHCTTEYPTADDEINLNAMKTIGQAFQMDVGFSDHSNRDTASIVAVAYGASVIEKHFTLDKCMEGPDHIASMNPEELFQFVSSIRSAELCLGSGIKQPVSSELNNIPVARRSLVATADIQVGDIFTEYNIGTKRPGIGSSPFRYWDVLGSVSTRQYSEGELI